MKVDKYKFVKSYVFAAFIAATILSLLFGFLTVFTHSEVIQTIYFVVSYAVPCLAAVHIFPTYIWDDGDMAVRNRRVIIPSMIACVFLIIVATVTLC